MRLSPETKHSLIVGGALIAAVVAGIIVFRKYQANSAAAQAQSDQSNADDLAYIESLALGGGYAVGGGGGGSSAITIPSAPATQSLADELASIEQAFGFGSTSSSTSGGGSSSSSTSHPGTPQPVGPQPVRSRIAPPPPPPSSDLAAYQPPIYSVIDDPVAAEGSHVA